MERQRLIALLFKVFFKRLYLITAFLFLFLNVSLASDEKEKELVIDHVMFPVYFNDSFIELVETSWKQKNVSRVFKETKNRNFNAVYFQSNSFYVEYLSTVKSQPYWSNSVYVIVPKKYWGYYKKPALLNDYFLIPEFGSGYQLVSPDYPYLNNKISKDIAYDGFTLLISKKLEKKLRNIAGQNWSLPKNGKIKVHDKLIHVHDMAVINEKSQLIAPILQTNPILRDYLFN